MIVPQNACRGLRDKLRSTGKMTWSMWVKVKRDVVGPIGAAIGAKRKSRDPAVGDTGLNGIVRDYPDHGAFSDPFVRFQPGPLKVIGRLNKF